MAGGMHRLKPPFTTVDPFAVADHDIGDKIPIATFLDPGLAALPAGMGAKAIGRRSCPLLQRSCRRRMVAMCMRHKDVRDWPSTHRIP